jgi:hypothetical protein
MNFLRRRLRRRVADMEADRWSTVSHLLLRGERQIEYTPCKFHFVEGTEVGYFFLTDQAVLLQLSDGEARRLGLREVRLVQDIGNGKTMFGFEVGANSFASTWSTTRAPFRRPYTPT